MNRCLKKIIAFFGIFSIVLSSTVTPAFARDGVIGGVVDGAQSFVEWSVNSMNSAQNAFWRVVFGEDFNSASEEELKAAYDDYVTTLPATGYTSTGGMLWYPSWKDYCNPLYGLPIILENNTPNPLSRTFNFNFRRNSSLGLGFKIQNLPVNGLYRVYEQAICHYQYLGDTSQIETKEERSRFSSNWIRRSLTDSLGSFDLTIYYPSDCYVTAELILPSFEVIPDTVIDKDTTYNINTRPTSITGGNYGIVGDNGQITKVEDNSTIINETNNTYYNPATGQTVPITGWSYDYSDRSYKVTLESGDTVTVTYGDENITIQEGDTIYNVYYLIDGSGSETPVDPPAACEHTWTETSTTPATCTMPGSKLFTCSKCQQTKTETVPALGHDWQVKQSVTTEYDDTGQLVQEGYTIFECSRCHEQYKSTDGTVPPGGGSGTDPGGEEGETIWDKLGNLIGAVGSGIIDLIDAALGKVLSIFDELPALFDGFLDFLVALFPFLPAELMAILTFGIIAIVFIGIIKAVRR